MIKGSGQFAPLFNRVRSPRTRSICPYVFEFLFEDHHGADDLIESQQLFKLVAMITSFYVPSVFKQQVLGSLEHRLVLLRGLAELAVAHQVDHAVEGGDHMEKIEYNLRPSGNVAVFLARRTSV